MFVGLKQTGDGPVIHIFETESAPMSYVIIDVIMSTDFDHVANVIDWFAREVLPVDGACPLPFPSNKMLAPNERGTWITMDAPTEDPRQGSPKACLRNAHNVL